ncbi:type IV toxin-antitoxin system AbiEi family antitoxin domain-containing protein [Mariniluteicoccus flavus]
MRTPHHISDRLTQLADFQAGVLSREQCLAEGLTRHSIRRLLRSGWRLAAPGIYLVHPGEPNTRAWAHAGTLYAGPGSAVGLEAAAYLMDWTPRPPAVVDVWAGRSRQLSDFGRVRFHRDSLQRDWQGWPAHTGAVTTALDLCAVADIDQMVTWLARGSRGGRRDRAMMKALSKRPHQPRRGLLAEMLTEVRLGVESPLERRFVADVLVARGLPVGQRQVRTVAGRVDLVDDEHRVVFELDGRLGHVGEGAFRDARRDNKNLVEGLVTLRYGWADSVGRPCSSARQVAPVLRSRGWLGVPHTCPRCS